MVAGGEAALDLTLRPSRIAWVAAAVIHSLMAAVSLWLAARFAPALLLLLAVCFAWWRLRERLSLKHPNSVLRIQSRSDDRWRVTYRNGATQDARLLPSSVVTHAVVIMHLELAAEREAIYLPFDALPADQHRRLRARLLVARFDEGGDQSPGDAA